jgi:hypothetical protein
MVIVSDLGRLAQRLKTTRTVAVAGELYVHLPVRILHRADGSLVRSGQRESC